MASQDLWAWRCASCFWCLAARFSLRDRPGFLACGDGFDFSPMPAAYGDDRQRRGLVLGATSVTL